MEITLYKNSAEDIRVDKTNYLSAPQTFTGTLREESSVIVPSIQIELPTSDGVQLNVANYNYAKIPYFNRYYYIKNITYDYNSLVTLDLVCDVLMSNKENLYNAKAILTRSPYGNAYFADREDTERLTMYKEVETRVVNAPGLAPCCILIVTG